MTERNVLGGELEPCGRDPMTGFHRDGSCACGPEDSNTLLSGGGVAFAEFSVLLGRSEFERNLNQQRQKSTVKSGAAPEGASRLVDELEGLCQLDRAT